MAAKPSDLSPSTNPFPTQDSWVPVSTTEGKTPPLPETEGTETFYTSRPRGEEPVRQSYARNNNGYNFDEGRYDRGSRDMYYYDYPTPTSSLAYNQPRRRRSRRRSTRRTSDEYQSKGNDQEQPDSCDPCQACNPCCDPCGNAKLNANFFDPNCNQMYNSPCQIGVIPMRSAAFQAPRIPLPKLCKHVLPDGDGCGCDEDGVAFQFKPQTHCRTEVTFTIEPKQQPTWLSMLNCGFKPMVNCSAPPCYLSPNGNPGMDYIGGTQSFVNRTFGNEVQYAGMANFPTLNQIQSSFPGGRVIDTNNQGRGESSGSEESSDDDDGHPQVKRYPHPAFQEHGNLRHYYSSHAYQGHKEPERKNVPRKSAHPHPNRKSHGGAHHRSKSLAHRKSMRRGSSRTTVTDSYDKPGSDWSRSSDWHP